VLLSLIASSKLRLLLTMPSSLLKGSLGCTWELTVASESAEVLTFVLLMLLLVPLRVMKAVTTRSLSMGPAFWM
jgi:hypothetical protein